MGLFSRSKPQEMRPAIRPSTAPPTAAVDWADIENIKSEWPRSALDPARDLQRFQQALALYERDDYSSMMQCATLFATALAHSLYGPGILHGDDLPNTIHKTLYCALCAPPGGRMFAESAQKAARLAMTIMRENGWQPTSLGGTMPGFEAMMTQGGNHMLLTAAIAPPDQPWAGNLRAFFSVAPTAPVEQLPDPDAKRGRQMIDRIHDTLEQSEAGDTASSLYMHGLAQVAQGDPAGALATYAKAAELGSVDAMASAGDASRELGRQDEANFWYESAANAGHPVGMFNTAIAKLQQGDQATAQQWFQRAAEAGNIEGYAALTQLAREAGNRTAEAHWARSGAEAGHLFCMAVHGLVLAKDANGDVPTLRRAREFLEQAGERGDMDSAVVAVNINDQLGDRSRGQRFVGLVVQSGDQDAIDRLRRYGYL